MKVNKKFKYVFYILYAVAFLGAGIIGFFSNSYFAYDKFNSPWADTFYVLFISMLFITAFVHEVFLSRAVKDIIVNCAVFIGGLVFLLLFYFLGGVVVLLTIIYSAIMLAVIGCRFAYRLHDNPNAKPDMKRVLAVFALFLFSMVALLGIEFVDNMLWVWALISAFLLFIIICAAAYFLLKKVWKRIYPSKRGAVGNAICMVILFFAFSYIFSAFTIGIANCVFDGKPAQTEYTVTEKRISTGSRSATTHKVKIVIDEKERWIPVTVTEYYEIETGDTVIINYYNGAFGFAYYSYYGKA